jgi:chemotaxis protein MotA
MVVIVGCILVVAAVLAGFTMAGGNVGALIHPSEIVTIGGAALGALIIMSPWRVLTDLLRCVLQVFKGTPYGRQTYVELFGLLYALARLVRRDGALALEAVISDPANSPLFAKFPRIARNHHARDFLCGALAQIVDGKAEPEQLAAGLEEEIAVIEREHHAAVGVLTKTADALPGFGIVAAVLGIVITMQAIDGPASEIGHKVGAALVGTFLGILLAYGFFSPMAARMEFLGENETTFFRTIAAAVSSMSGGDGPRDVILRARRIVGSDCKPTVAEMAAIQKSEG